MPVGFAGLALHCQRVNDNAFVRHITTALERSLVLLELCPYPDTLSVIILKELLGTLDAYRVE